MQYNCQNFKSICLGPVKIMSNDKNTVTNLIDLSADDDVSSPIATSNPSNISAYTPPIPLVLLTTNEGRESFENNPFDCVQQQANRPDDPFELISREAFAQPETRAAQVSQSEVITGNLLWISDDSVKVEDDNPQQNAAPEFSKLQVPSSRFGEPISSVSSIESAVDSPCNDSAFTSRNDSSKTVNKAFITDNTISSLSEDSRAQSLMNKGFVGSYSSFDVSQSSVNSTPELAQPPPENSDSSGKVRSQKAVDARKRLLKLSLTNFATNSPLSRRPSEKDENSSPFSSVFSEAENLADHFSSRLLLDSTKVYDDSCDDLMAIKPNWVDSETDIDSDLEMMKIPILEQIISPVVVSKLMPWSDTSAEKPALPVITKNSPDLEALKEKVQQHKAENQNNQEIGSLIENLKKVIKDCANDTKKAEANNLLESLSNLMNDKRAGGTTDKMDTLTAPPQPIQRQGTFDIELKENEKREEREETENEDQQRQLEAPNNEKPDLQSKQEPDLNISDKIHPFDSPEIAQPEVSNIVEQIGRLLCNQNVNVVQANLNTGSSNGTTNPTYIVVMNTPIPPKQRPSIIPSEYQNDGSPELSQSYGRRRSQSLSIHDKSTQFVAPAPPNPNSNRNECRTPARGTMMRRNSFSNATSGTPSAPMARRSIYGGSNPTDTVTKHNQMTTRRSMALETHHECQQHLSQPPTPMQIGSISLNAKKLKFKQSTESIVKASGPMKATIPVKKVAPMIVTTTVDSPIEEPSKYNSVTSTPNVQLVTSKGYPNACSTPVVEASPIKRVGATKPRYSFVAAPPTPKQSSLAQGSNQIRRRTVNEIRSPKKFGEKPTSSGISKPAVKTMKLPQNFSKTLNKMTPSSSRGVLRLSKPAVMGAADKNKENKLPKSGR